jgi:hypothetical protein
LMLVLKDILYLTFVETLNWVAVNKFLHTKSHIFWFVTIKLE